MFREELKKRRLKKSAPATSKYKFFPRLLLASANPPSERELSGTRPTKKRRHTTKCQRYNRFKAPPIDAEEAAGKQSKSLRKDKRFLRKVDEYKLRKMAMGERRPLARFNARGLQSAAAESAVARGGTTACGG